MKDLLKLYFREHPTLLLTLCYLIITLIGVLYSYYLYAEFEIQIVKFADISDFLLAAILEPLAVIIFVAWVGTTLVLLKLELGARRRFKGYGNWVNKRLLPKYSDPISIFFVIVLITTMYVRDLAIRNADDIKAGDVDAYSVRLTTDNKTAPTKTYALLGNTSRFTYFYDLAQKQSIVVPTGSIALMVKVPSDRESTTSDEASTQE